MENTEKHTKLYGIGSAFLTILFGVLMLNFFIDAFVYNQTQIVTFDLRKVILFLIVLLGIMLCVTVKGNGGKHSRWKGILVVGVILVLQVLVVAASIRVIGWDCGTVISLADQLQTSHSVTAPDYMARYPNNALLICFWHAVFTITNRLGIFCWKAAVWINIVCIDSAVYLVCRICRKLWDEKVELCALIFSTMMMGFSFWNVIPYTDTLSMPVPLLLFWLFLKMKEAKRWKTVLYAVLFGALSFVGYMLKPTNIIIVIAIVLVMVLQIRMEKKLLIRAGTAVLAVVLSFGVTSELFQLYKGVVYAGVITEEDEYNYSFDMLHYLKMGMKEPYGSFNQDDVDMMCQIVGRENKREYNLQMIQERLKDHGPVGYLKFLYKKGSFVYTDGTFCFGGEGHFYLSDCLKESSGPLKVLSDMRTYGTDGYLRWSCNMAEAIWIAILGYMFVGAVVDLRKKKRADVLVLRTAILGITAFLLLFEGRSRYLMNHLPIMIILASYGCVKFNNFLQQFLLRRTSRQEKKGECDN